MRDDVILLDHGSGGLASAGLISRLFLARYGNPVLAELEDSAILDRPAGRIAFTTDGYVVDPIFFPGGDIGSLAVHGTVNDLAMRGAVPVSLSVSFILEEGLPVRTLEKIASSIAEASARARVSISAGDTKVVPQGKADKVFITTSGLGVVPDGVELSATRARPGDRILVSGTIGDHGATILTRRAGLAFSGGLASDTAPLHDLVRTVLEGATGAVRAFRDPTRGGAATVLCEIASRSGLEIEVEEASIPIRPEVASACEILGLDPLYLANEGKCIAVVSPDMAKDVEGLMHACPEGRDAAVIGEVREGRPGRVILRTAAGGLRVLRPLSGTPLPRIC